MSFNALLQQDRPERLFAFHLQRLDIERVLDIGSNSGQFAGKLRALGYRGFIFSVEPQSAAYLQLLANSGGDERWLPLPRQRAGAESGCGELLRAEFMSTFEALKIDAQGNEAKVLEGYRPLLGQVRLLLLQPSLVERSHGAPNLFVLDSLLVESLGFRRISLEPSHYDDTRGVVERYAGIYYRPEPVLPRPRAPAPSVAAVVTSIGGSLDRRSRDGTNVGEEWLSCCAQSWSSLAPRVLSVSERAPALPGVHWIEVAERPSIAELFRIIEHEVDQHALLVNADIALTRELERLLPELDPSAVYYGQRFDVEMGDQASDSMLQNGFYRWGFDYFLLPSEFTRLVNREGRIPEAFKIGEPWWDYLLPVLAIGLGFPIKRLRSPSPIALHYTHEAKYSQARWLANGQSFLEYIRDLQRQPHCHGAGVFAEILEPGGIADGEQRLSHAARVICDTLP